MASYIALVIVAAFSAAFCGLDYLEAFLASQSHTPTSHGARADADATAGALLLAIVATFALASALLLAHVRNLGAHATGAGGAEHGLDMGRLASAALAAYVAVIVVGAMLCRVA